MFLNILKKDLKRKRAMNIILLIFIIIATMFVSSSVNNIISVTTALDDYFDMADVPDYYTVTFFKDGHDNPKEAVNEIDFDGRVKYENVIFMSPSTLYKDGKNISDLYTSIIVQSDMGINYLLEDNSILKDVHEGEVYITKGKLEELKLSIGDMITVKYGDTSRELTIKGTFSDALLGTNIRLIMNSKDFDTFFAIEELKYGFGGIISSFHTADTELIEKFNENGTRFSMSYEKSTFKAMYIFDMIITGILLVVSVILIAIAFVVLRFTITFTISEEFREIGVMKAIGISNFKIRGLYLVKYTALSVIGAVIGLILSFPFGEMLMEVSEQSIIINNSNPVFINIICTLAVVGIILLFSYGCTSKVKKLSPIDAIRNGQTGERFRKKSLMNLGKSKLNTTPFLAINDIISSPKRFGIISLTFVLCLSLLLILSTTVKTLKSDSLLYAFSVADFDITAMDVDSTMDFMTEGGREKVEKYLSEKEEKLAQKGIPADCAFEMCFELPVKCGEHESSIMVSQGVGTTMNMYQYTEGTPPQNENEIAITRIAAEKIHAAIGDTVTISTIEGEFDFIITAYFQTMMDMGLNIRLHENFDINFVQANSTIAGVQFKFADNPDDKEIERRIENIIEICPEFTEKDIFTGAEFVDECTAVAEPLNAIKLMFSVLTIILTALITVLMERSFIAKEQGEIALMKAVGIKNSKIYAYHTMRFLFVGIIAIIIGEIFAIPLTHLCIDPVFKMMGLELAVDYVTNPLEMWLIFPVIILAVTTISAYFTSLYTRKIKASDVSGIE